MGVKNEENQIFQVKKFTNLAGELDWGTQYFHTKVNPTLLEKDCMTQALPDVGTL